jgi:hypothetical protein
MRFLAQINIIRVPQRLVAALAGANANHFLNRVNKDQPVPNFPVPTALQMVSMVFSTLWSLKMMLLH